MAKNPWNRWDRAIAARLDCHVLVAHGIRRAIERAGYDELQAEAFPWDDARDLLGDTQPDAHLERALERLHLTARDEDMTEWSPRAIDAWLNDHPAPEA